MSEQARHVPLRPTPWNPGEAAAAIEEIAADAAAHFDPRGLWPSHPLEDGAADGNASLYLGAAGVIWALDHLARAGAVTTRFDARAAVPRLIEAAAAEVAAATYGEYTKHGSILLGDLGALLVAMRIDPSPSLADRIHARAKDNDALPIRELMWGVPGSMLACLHTDAMTQEPRWRALFEAQAARLLDDLHDSNGATLWTQDLYSSHERWLGAVHGYASNMAPVLRGWAWLTQAQRERVAATVAPTLAATALRTRTGLNWPGVVGAGEGKPQPCQHCHGAPGMVTIFADAPFASAELDALLVAGGDFIWAAGPLAKGCGLCHGTAGNGYAFLKLHRRTGDALWLERTRAFAMTAIAQCREARQTYGRGRYSLWTGDVGLAVYLSDCLTAEPRFPSVDVF